MADVAQLAKEIAALRAELGVLQDKDEIQRLQYAYGYFIDNRMFREMADLFADDAWIEIGRRGRYYGKERIHQFLLEVLGAGRWGLAKDEVINHVQLQAIIDVAPDRRTAKARSRAIVQGKSPPGLPTFLYAEGVYENEYVKDGGTWKIQGIGVAMTFYVELAQVSVAYQSGPASESFPADAPSQPDAPGLGRQFNAFHYPHPITGAALPASPASDPKA